MGMAEVINLGHFPEFRQILVEFDNLSNNVIFPEWIGVSVMKEKWVTLYDLPPQKAWNPLQKTFQFYYTSLNGASGIWVAVWDKDPRLSNPKEITRRYFTMEELGAVIYQPPEKPPIFGGVDIDENKIIMAGLLLGGLAILSKDR